MAHFYNTQTIEKLKTIIPNISEHNLLNDLLILYKNKIEGKHILKFANLMKDRWNINNIIQANILSKQAKTNKTTCIYNIDYISLINNISILEAEQIVLKFKADKATSKENFIKKHGEEKGSNMFKRFQETSKSSSDNIKKRLKDIHGDNWENEWIKNKREKTQRCPEYYLSRKIAKNLDEAIKMVSEYQHRTAGINRQVYIDKGYSDEDINEILVIIKSKQKNHGRNRKFLKEKYGNEWEDIYEKNAKVYRKQMEKKGIWISEEELDNFRLYKIKVGYATRQSIDMHFIEDIEKRSLEWHVDHIFSVKEGYVQDVDPKIIGSLVNLRILKSELNMSKKAKCDHTLEELYNKYNTWKLSKNEN